jgi:exodeoxyribonuclease V alpha subunit
MPTYDLQDPTDIDILRANFDIISRSEWDEYIALAEERNIGYKNINILKTAERKAGISKFLSPKVILWVMNLVERLDADEEEE